MALTGGARVLDGSLPRWTTIQPQPLHRQTTATFGDKAKPKTVGYKNKMIDRLKEAYKNLKRRVESVQHYK
jgi:hypothetical protein